MPINKKQKKELNALLHEYCRLRDGDKCLHCGKSGDLQLSHIYPKGRYKKMEFDEDNLKLLCWHCHFGWWHKNPIEAHEWLKEILSAKRLRDLQFRAQTVNKTILDFKLVKIYLEQKIKKLNEEE